MDEKLGDTFQQVQKYEAAPIALAAAGYTLWQPDW
jgi:hypothetical protein